MLTVSVAMLKDTTASCPVIFNCQVYLGHRWELNQISTAVKAAWPYKFILCTAVHGVMPGRRAGSGVGKCNAESPKQGSKRFKFIMKTIHCAHLGVLFIYDLGVQFQGTMSPVLTARPKIVLLFLFYGKAKWVPNLYCNIRLSFEIFFVL